MTDFISDILQQGENQYVEFKPSFNPGILPDTITIEQLRNNQYISTPRNRQIAKIAKEMGLIERYGTGIKRVRNMFIDYNNCEPQYELISGGLLVTAFALNFGSKENIIEQDKVPNKVPDNITENQKSIIILIEGNNKISMNELSVKIGISKRKILDNINKLKEMNLLDREGNNKTGYWKLK
ncbi:MAG: winged helix-turn-helix transcriptional regulator [Prevotellaceae bacterium]|jgi:ATP-dependent DNA helicase RecG|nr:winged helix-turn-helix transcriptional regulator [Prevotellaceae bacterium]